MNEVSESSTEGSRLISIKRSYASYCVSFLIGPVVLSLFASTLMLSNPKVAYVKADSKERYSVESWDNCHAALYKLSSNLLGIRPPGGHTRRSHWSGVLE